MMNGVSPKQRNFLEKLIEMTRERGGEPPIEEDAIDDLSLKDASDFINEMKAELGLD